MSTPKRKSLSELRKSEHTGPVEHSFDICVAGGLIAEYEELDAQFRAVYVEGGGKPSNLRRADGPSEAVQIAERMEEMRDQMAEHMASVRVGRAERHKWREFVAEHPPRDGDRDDAFFRVDMDALVDNLEQHVLAINGEPPGEGDWQFIAEVASDGDLREIAAVVATMHVTAVSIPKSRLDWLKSQEPESDDD